MSQFLLRLHLFLVGELESALCMFTSPVWYNVHYAFAMCCLSSVSIYFWKKCCSPPLQTQEYLLVSKRPLRPFICGEDNSKARGKALCPCEERVGCLLHAELFLCNSAHSGGEAGSSAVESSSTRRPFISAGRLKFTVSFCWMLKPLALSLFPSGHCAGCRSPR